MYRITMTPPTINHALDIIFLVTGESKAVAVNHILEGAFEPQQYPAQLIQCIDNKTLWYLDTKAASKLSMNSYDN